MMKKKIFVALLTIGICLIVAGIALGLGVTLNTITFHGTINGGPKMNAISLDLGTMQENSTGGSGPSQNGVPVDSNVTLNLPSTENVTLAFANATGDLAPFTAFQCSLSLYQNGSPVYFGSISETSPTFTILNVNAGTYEVYVGWTYTAGLNPANVTVTVNIGVT